jgi:hypothetical protein
MPERYFLAMDCSFHWYLVPVSQRDAWNLWEALNSGDGSYQP